jgi:hypothetical protein
MYRRRHRAGIGQYMIACKMHTTYIAMPIHQCMAMPASQPASRLLQGQFIPVLPLTIGSFTTNPKWWRFWSPSSCCQRKDMAWADLVFACSWNGLASVSRLRCGSALSFKGRSKSVLDCSLAYTDQQFAFCEPFQKNVNCTYLLNIYIIWYQLNLWMLFYMSMT